MLVGIREFCPFCPSAQTTSAIPRIIFLGVNGMAEEKRMQGKCPFAVPCQLVGYNPVCVCFLFLKTNLKIISVFCSSQMNVWASSVHK